MKDYTIPEGYYVNVQNGMFVAGAYSGFGGRKSTLVGRERIGEFTASSRKRFRRYLRNAAAKYRVFITLTYPGGERAYGHDGVECKRHIDAFCKRYAAHCQRRGARKWAVVWWQEWQADGTLHYHLLGTGYCHYAVVAGWWYEIVGSVSLAHFVSGTQIKKIRGNNAQLREYATKYAVKSEQKLVPLGYTQPGRFWGVRGFRLVVEATISWKAWKMKSGDLHECRHNMDKVMWVAQKKGKCKLISILIGDMRMYLWVWDIDDHAIRHEMVCLVSQMKRILSEVKA